MFPTKNRVVSGCFSLGKMHIYLVLEVSHARAHQVVFSLGHWASKTSENPWSFGWMDACEREKLLEVVT